MEGRVVRKYIEGVTWRSMEGVVERVVRKSVDNVFKRERCRERERLEYLKIIQLEDE